MSINLIDMLKDRLVGQLAGGLASKVGGSEEETKGGLEALIPTILGGLISQMGKPGGADKVNETLDSDDYSGGLLDSILGGGEPNTEELGKQGGGLVDMIFGDKGSMIGDILGKVTGSKGGLLTALLPMVLPLIMNFLGKQKRAMGLDSTGFTQMLMDQKENVASAMPAGLSDQLGWADLSPPKPAASSPAPASEGGGMGSIVIPIAILALIAFIGYQVISSQNAKEVESPVENIEEVEDDLLDIDMGEIDSGNVTDSSTGLPAQ